jgi:RNA polymerase sigma-70 factor (ECF subfamily)
MLPRDHVRLSPFMQTEVAELEAHRGALTGHCYRMLGSVADAEDAVQETLVRAWRSLDRFEGRASVKTWLYRIATNVCLDALASDARRFRPVDERAAGTIDDPLEALDRTHWLEPIPDASVIPAGADPFEAAALRQSIRLAFVAALQQLPPKQRAALILSEVVGWSAAEIADCLETTTASVNSALQRARATLGNRATPRAAETLSDEQTELLGRYLDAFHRYDVDALVATLHHDATLSMPPYTLWLRGPDAVRGWLLGRGSVCRGSRLLPIAACGSPAFAHYHSDGGDWKAWGIIVLELDDSRITAWNEFLDAETLFPLFDLPLTLPA